MQISKKLCWLFVPLFWLAGCSQVQDRASEEVTGGEKATTEVVVGKTEKPGVKETPVAVKTSPGNDGKVAKVGDKAVIPTVVKVLSIEEILKRANDYYDRKDFVNAVVWYQRAADQGVSKAQYRLGEMCYNGEGVLRNFVQAEKWYRQAAAQGDGLAQYRLGKLYYAIEDYSQAILWFIKSARQEVAEAQKMLGRMYYQGQGTSPQLKEAFYWSLKAAEQGLADAQSNVALMYFKGEGVEKDYIRSYQWVSLAAAQGNQEAFKVRDLFVSKISPAQLSEGERLAREWAAKHPAKK
jgi:TPR repeat protein